MRHTNFLVNSSCSGICHDSSPCRGAPVSSTSHCSFQKWTWGLLFQLRSRPCYWQGCENHRANRGHCLTSHVGSGHHNTNHTSHQGDNSQYTLRKDVAGIHTKNSPHTKNIRLMESTQRCSHLKQQPFKTTVDNCFS